MNTNSYLLSNLQHAQARNAELTAIIEMGDSGVMYAVAGGQISHTNAALRRMFLIDKSWHHALTLMSFEQHLESLLDAAEPQRKPVSALLDQLRQQRAPAQPHRSVRFRLASPRQAVVQVSACSNPQGDVVLHFRDVTAEFEVDQMKSEFLSTAAHELRTPLSSIFGFTELMISREMPAEQQRDLLQTVHRQARLLIDLINELLDLSRIEARQGKDFHRQYCRVERVVRETLRGLLVQGDRRQVQLAMEHGREGILVDPDKTQQALLNVLSNAFKYSPLGGDIVLDTVHRLVPGGQEVGIRVTDQGIGMTATQLAHVFDRFFRADPSGDIPGTGLGMSLVKEIVELQEGHVQVESTLGVGTAVTLWFGVAADFVLSQPFVSLDSTP